MSEQFILFIFFFFFTLASLLSVTNQVLFREGANGHVTTLFVKHMEMDSSDKIDAKKTNTLFFNVLLLHSNIDIQSTEINYC